MEVEHRRFTRLAARLGQRVDRDAHIRLVELTLGCERDDDPCDVDARREPVGGVRRAGARERGKRPTVRGLEEGVDARLGVGEQLPMRRLEARSAACGCRHDELRPSVGPFYTVSCARE